MDYTEIRNGQARLIQYLLEYGAMRLIQQNMENDTVFSEFYAISC